MEETSTTPQEGLELIDTVVHLTGLPKELVQKELRQILAQSGLDASNLTIDQLRTVMAEYLDAVHSDILLDSCDEKNQASN